MAAACVYRQREHPNPPHYLGVAVPEFAPIHWKVFEKFLFFVGCAFVDQKGAHRKYWRSGLRRPVIITVSKGGEIPRQHIKTNLKTLEMSVREYLEILRRVK